MNPIGVQRLWRKSTGAGTGVVEVTFEDLLLFANAVEEETMSVMELAYTATLSNLQDRINELEGSNND